MIEHDRRLIEDYLPIEAISLAASSEPRVKGYISTLHLWRARRPLVACRAAVYGALVSAPGSVPESGPEDTMSQRAAAGDFLKRLCRYPGSPQAIAEARQNIATAHAKR